MIKIEFIKPKVLLNSKSVFIIEDQSFLVSIELYSYSSFLSFAKASVINILGNESYQKLFIGEINAEDKLKIESNATQSKFRFYLKNPTLKQNVKSILKFIVDDYIDPKTKLVYIVDSLPHLMLRLLANVE